MMKFHVRYKSGATFTYVHEVKSNAMLSYLISQFNRDLSVERVLVEVV